MTSTTTSATLVGVDRRDCAPGTPPVQIIHLRLEDAGFDFSAGQYLEIVHPSGETIALSIASSARHLPDLWLHFRSVPGAPGAAALEELLEHEDRLKLRGPSGDVKVRAEESRSALLIAGGTGLAQALSIAETLTERNLAPDSPLASTHPDRSHRVLACADSPEDFYCADRFTRLAGIECFFIADAQRSERNRALTWLREHAGDLLPVRIIVSGSPGFVYAVTETLEGLGIDISAIESDVFAYAPR